MQSKRVFSFPPLLDNWSNRNVFSLFLPYVLERKNVFIDPCEYGDRPPARKIPSPPTQDSVPMDAQEVGINSPRKSK